MYSRHLNCRGFITMTILAVIVISTAVLSGVGYSAYKYQEVQKDKEIARLNAELDILNKDEEETEDDIGIESITDEVKVEVKNTPNSTPQKSIVSTQPKAVIVQKVTPIQTTEILAKPVELKPVRVLLQSDRDHIALEAQKIINFSDKVLKSLESRMAVIKKSSYRSEYLSAEKALLETMKLYESDKKMAEMIISASKNAGEEDYTAVNSAFRILIESANETANDTEFMLASIDNLMKLSQEIIELVIELKVIDDLSAQYGVSSVGSALPPPGHSQSVQSATNKADEYIKSLASKYDDEKEVKNYLIGIIIFY